MDFGLLLLPAVGSHDKPVRNTLHTGSAGKWGHNALAPGQGSTLKRGA